MGYEGVEFAGYYGRDAQTLRRLLDERNLRCAGTHTGLDTLLGDPFERTVEFNQILGNPFLIVPGLPKARTETPQAWRETAAVFNEIAERLRSRNMRTGYHNHHTEFHPMDGELPWDIFFGNTDQDVIMQFDTGNALHGGGEALPFLQRYPGRAVTVHLKDYDTAAQSFDPPVGEGSVPFRDIFEVCESTGGTQWYIVEYEADAYPSLEGVERCIKNLKTMGK
jgi:sugar phosphate isomerase/epimerase